MNEPKYNDLQKVCKEVNNFLEENIPIVGKKKEYMVSCLKEKSTEILENLGKISSGGKNTLSQIGISKIPIPAKKERAGMQDIVMSMLSSEPAMQCFGSEFDTKRAKCQNCNVYTNCRSEYLIFQKEMEEKQEKILNLIQEIKMEEKKIKTFKEIFFSEKSKLLDKIRATNKKIRQMRKTSDKNLHKISV